MLNHFQTHLLQQAMDEADTITINKIMPLLFVDYLQSYAPVLVAYNKEANIKAVDIVSLKRLNPRIRFCCLFIFGEGLVKFMCRNNVREYFKKIS
ncbi:MAG: hypothetical protein APF84_12575 [Gracilibacter sp. BRH_c7a]|nr:MAG: hypothetical protein APF84_12575 [Gracilibacter sp. BRH_c7a]